MKRARQLPPRIRTSPTLSYSVKSRVVNLSPHQEYFYRFTTAADSSPVGRFRTARPAGSSETVVGDVVEAIVAAASKDDVILIVIASHGRGPVGRLLLGSVAEKVARAASCPVLTIRPESFQFQMP